MNQKINKIIENLETLTLLETSELITKIKDIFNIDINSSINFNTNKDQDINLNTLEDKKLSDLEDRITEYEIAQQKNPTKENEGMLIILQNQRTRIINEANAGYGSSTSSSNMDLSKFNVVR